MSFLRKNPLKTAWLICRNIHQTSAKKIFPGFHDENFEKFGDARDKNTVGNSFCILKKKHPEYETTSTIIIPTRKISFLHHLKPNTGVNLHRCFPSLTSPNRAFLKTFLVLQLVLLIVANQQLTPCLAQNQIEPEDYQIYSDGESDIIKSIISDTIRYHNLSPSELEILYQLYDDTSTTSGIHLDCLWKYYFYSRILIKLDLWVK